MLLAMSCTMQNGVVIVTCGTHSERSYICAAFVEFVVVMMEVVRVVIVCRLVLHALFD